MGYRGSLIVKSDTISVENIDWGLTKGNMSLDCPLQRESDQWTNEMKSNQISDMLQSREFPNLTMFEFSDDGNADAKIMYVIDGKQRITNVQSYINNGWSISKNVRRYNIDYQTKNENGVMEWKTFDIRGRKFRDLPEELRMDLRRFCWHVNIDLNGTKEDLKYEIERLNDGKPMNNSQKAVLKLGVEYASKIKEISTSEFFNDGKFKASEEKKNAYERICVDSLMVISFLTNWKKSTTDNAKYIAANATYGDIEVFAEEVNRLQSIVDRDMYSLFTLKETHIWLALFDKFTNLELDDEKFGEFLTEFINELHAKEIDGISYDMLLEDRRTRDKSTICKKIVFLYDLLMEFLSVESDEDDDLYEAREIANTYVPVIENKEVA